MLLKNKTMMMVSAMRDNEGTFFEQEKRLQRRQLAASLLRNLSPPNMLKIRGSAPRVKAAEAVEPLLSLSVAAYVIRAN